MRRTNHFHHGEGGENKDIRKHKHGIIYGLTKDLKTLVNVFSYVRARRNSPSLDLIKDPPSVVVYLVDSTNDTDDE